MQLTDFDFDLPQELIAQYPPAQRRDARMLIMRRGSDALNDARITELLPLIEAGDLVVLNDTRVIPARLFGRKETGGAVEILIERPISEHRALAHVSASKTPRPGSRITLDPRGEITVTGRDGEWFVIESEPCLQTLLGESGHVPLPPYIDRADETIDSERYQTVYASKPGAVAAPTAGLHLDREMLEELTDRGVELAYVTLHIGAGTFQPVRTPDLDLHTMHAERVEVSPEVCHAIERTRARGGRIIAVGTTVVRALETAASGQDRIDDFCGETRLFIRPGFEFRCVDAMLTNFHLPRSTLLMLVCAFGGIDRVTAAYRHAVDAGYRFFSYGDAMWIE